MQGDKIISSTLSSNVLLSYKLIIYKLPQNPMSLRAIYKLNQYLLLTMYTSTNTQYGPASSITTLAIVPSTSLFVKQYDLENTTNNMFAKNIDKIDKKDKNMKALFAK